MGVMRKLTDEQVLEIRAARKKGVHIKTLAEIYHVSIATISTWASRYQNVNERPRSKWFAEVIDRLERIERRLNENV